MKTVQRKFCGTVWGYVTVKAKTPDQAMELFEVGEADEFDNKSGMEWDDDITEVKK